MILCLTTCTCNLIWCCMACCVGLAVLLTLIDCILLYAICWHNGITMEAFAEFWFVWLFWHSNNVACLYLIIPASNYGASWTLAPYALHLPLLLTFESVLDYTWKKRVTSVHVCWNICTWEMEIVLVLTSWNELLISLGAPSWMVHSVCIEPTLFVLGQKLQKTSLCTSSVILPCKDPPAYLGAQVEYIIPGSPVEQLCRWASINIPIYLVGLVCYVMFVRGPNPVLFFSASLRRCWFHLGFLTEYCVKGAGICVC